MMNGEKIKITNQDKKEFLLLYQNCENEIERSEEEIERWESRAERVTASCHLARGGGGGDDRIQRAVDVLAELRGLLYDKLTDAAETRREIEAAIASVEGVRLRLLLEYRYIDGMRWEDVAEKLGVSWQHIHRMHTDALNVIECDRKPVI